MSDNKLQNQLAEQGKMIAELTETVSRFVSFSIANSSSNTSYSLAKNPKKCYNIGVQNIKGRSIKQGQFAENSKQLNEEETEFMRTQKNVRLRKDGRFEWQKMIGGVWHREIDKDYRELKRKITEHTRELKKILKHSQFAKRLKRDCPILFDLCKVNVKTTRKDVKKVEGLLNNYLSKLDKPIDEYTKTDILSFLKELPVQPLVPYQILKNTFAEAAEEGIIERNPISTLKCPQYEKKKGRWFRVEEQKIIHARKSESGMADEIDFYLMVGCRANEVLNCKPDFDNCRVWVERDKTDGTSGYVKISQAYCNELRGKWHTMFKTSKQGRTGKGRTYSLKFKDFLVSIGLKFKDTCLHSLRHTFCSNLYYLGAPDKYRQHAMGHKDSRMTSDRYTTYDPNVTRQDIIKIYGTRYPTFDNNNNAAALLVS